MAVFDDLIELGFDYDYVSNLSPEIQERLLAQRTNQGQQHLLIHQGIAAQLGL